MPQLNVTDELIAVLDQLQGCDDALLDQLKGSELKPMLLHVIRWNEEQQKRVGSLIALGELEGQQLSKELLALPGRLSEAHERLTEQLRQLEAVIESQKTIDDFEVATETTS